MPTLTLRLDYTARQRCLLCASNLPQAGAVVTDDAQVTRFLCNAHLAAIAEVCELVPMPVPSPAPDIDYFATHPYGYLY